MSDQDRPAESAPQQDDPSTSEASEGGSLERDVLQERIVEQLHTIYDPEIPVDIYDLGLIYGYGVDEDEIVHVKMTLTSPACPIAGSILAEVERKVCEIDGVERCKVELVWDPPWNPTMMSEAARLKLNI